MKYAKKNKNKFLVGAVITFILIAGVVLFTPSDVYADCSGGCCVANCDEDCCTGSKKCGDCDTKYCETCSCSKSGNSSCACTT